MFNRFKCGELNVEVLPDHGQMGRLAARCAAVEIRHMLAQREAAAVLFSSAKSQIDLLDALRREDSLDWGRVIGFHVDEYVGICSDHVASFRGFLRKSLLDHVSMGRFHGIRGEASDPASECDRYIGLLRIAQPGLVILGIGENGHLAFIDPGVCDFEDRYDMRLVELDETCRGQQVHDGAFSRIEDVPRAALSVTVPFLMRVPRVLVVVPGPRKAGAVRAALEGPITPECPASILRQHRNATLLLDAESAALLTVGLHLQEAALGCGPVGNDVQAGTTKKY